MDKIQEAWKTIIQEVESECDKHKKCIECPMCELCCPMPSDYRPFNLLTSLRYSLYGNNSMDTLSEV